jgi:hypothetical protein
MSKEVVAEVIALIELGLIAPEDIVKCLRKANSEPEKALVEQPAQQEPVATGDTLFRQFMSEAEKAGVTHWPTLPAAQRTWVGLTIEDKKEYIAQDFGGSRTDAMDWTEKRLMEKNK